MDLVKEQAKVRVLRETADNLESRKFEYYWGSAMRCNLGSVLNTLNGGEPVTFFRGSYTESIVRCEVSGEPFDEVIQQLLDFGFTRDELVRIELDDVSEHAHLEGNVFPLQFTLGNNGRLNAVQHLRNIANEIEARAIAYQPTSTPEAQRVGVSV